MNNILQVIIITFGFLIALTMFLKLELKISLFYIIKYFSIFCKMGFNWLLSIENHKNIKVIYFCKKFNIVMVETSKGYYAVSNNNTVFYWVANLIGLKSYQDYKITDSYHLFYFIRHDSFYYYVETLKALDRLDLKRIMDQVIIDNVPGTPFEFLDVDLIGEKMNIRLIDPYVHFEMKFQYIGESLYISLREKNRWLYRDTVRSLQQIIDNNDLIKKFLTLCIEGKTIADKVVKVKELS